MSLEDKIIDGKKISSRILEEIKLALRESSVKPGLALILVGNNPASEVYVKMKGKACEDLGYYSITDKLPSDTTEKELLGIIDRYNEDERIHGILVQLPLPGHISEMKILEAVDYTKDVDGFHPVNTGRLVSGEKCFVPCTPLGIIELLKRYNIRTSGKNVAVIGRSNIVGKPVAGLLMQKNEGANATVTVCHSLTRDISEHTKIADIVIAAIGKAYFLKPEMVKEGCVLVDVGINRIEDPGKKSGYRLAGDIDFEGCLPKASMITPVPGGVGPMTIAMLMKNTFDSARKTVYP